MSNDTVVKAIIGKKARVKGAPRSKRSGANDTPSRIKYRLHGFAKMRARKIRNLMRYCKLTREAAERLWDSTRVRGKRAT
jgi:hypothetical protein